METESGIGTRHLEAVAARNFQYGESPQVETIQTGKIDGYVRPIGGVNNDGPFEFILEPAGDTFLQMDNLYLYAKLRITNGDGTACAPDVTCAPINLLGAVMWQEVQIKLNDVAFNGATATNAHYKAAIETLLSYDLTSKNCHLKAAIMDLDAGGTHDVMTALNTGYVNRRRLAANSMPFETCAPITGDFIKADRFLAPGNKLSIELHRASDAFLLMSLPNTQFRLHIQDLRLYYNRIHTIPQMVRKVLSLKEHNYWMHRTEMKQFNIGAQMTGHSCQIVSGPALPKTIIIAFASTTAVSGSCAHNPLNFAHFNIRRINLRVNGSSVPSDAFTPDFANGLFAREYMNMFMQTGNYRIDRGNCISSSSFASGYTLFPFNIGDPDLCNQFHNHLPKSGVVELEVYFDQPLPNPITILAHLTFNELVTTKGTREPFKTQIY